MQNKIIITKKSDIIPYVNEQGLSLAQVGRMLKPKRSPSTMWKWVKELRDAGYTINTKKGRKKTLEL